MEEGLKTLKQMAKILSVHPSTLRGWARSSQVPYYRIGKKYFFRENEVLKSSVISPSEHIDQKIFGEHNGICLSNGYVFVRLGKHPMANKNGYAPLHRIIMQALLGRPLKKDEIVHQKNGKTLDCTIKNLELLASLSKHNKENKFMREDR